MEKHLCLVAAAIILALTLSTGSFGYQPGDPGPPAEPAAATLPWTNPDSGKPVEPAAKVKKQAAAKPGKVVCEGQFEASCREAAQCAWIGSVQQADGAVAPERCVTKQAVKADEKPNKAATMAMDKVSAEVKAKDAGGTQEPQTTTVKIEGSTLPADAVKATAPARPVLP